MVHASSDASERETTYWRMVKECRSSHSFLWSRSLLFPSFSPRTVRRYPVITTEALEHGWVHFESWEAYLWRAGWRWRLMGKRVWTCAQRRPTVGSLSMARTFLEPVRNGLALPKWHFLEMGWPLRGFIAGHKQLFWTPKCRKQRGLTWGPSTLPLQDPTDQRIMQILRPVLDQECFSVSSVMLCSNLDHYDSSRDCPYKVLLRFLYTTWTDTHTYHIYRYIYILYICIWICI